MKLKTIPLLALVALAAPALRAQTVDDGVMIPRNSLCAGLAYSHDRWDRYWEGGLERVNGNIGAITTESFGAMGDYGVTDRLNVLVMLPYVRTHASQGVLHGMSGFQDLTMAAKYALFDRAFTSRGRLRAIAVAAAGVPVSDYTPDFQPLSIGLASKRLSGRFTVNFQSDAGWFVNTTAAYTWRGNVKLDRPTYFTDGQFFVSDDVAMPDVFDYALSAGYRKHGLHVPISFAQQRTQGGGDIRRQDMPFVSNRMNSSRIEAVAMYSLPRASGLALRAAASHVLSGRNVGQATTLTGGLMYTFHF